MSLSLYFRWFDLWVGVYIDRKHGRAYVQPLPCIGLLFQLEEPDHA